VGPGRRVSYHFVPRARAHPRRVYLLTSRETSRGSGCESADLARSGVSSRLVAVLRAILARILAGRGSMALRGSMKLSGDTYIRGYIREDYLRRVTQPACETASFWMSVGKRREQTDFLPMNSGLFAFVGLDRNKRALWYPVSEHG